MQNLIDWLLSGFIGLAFGIISAWVTYRYQRKRDDIAWAREKQKMQGQFAHEKELLEAQLRDQAERQKENQLRVALTRGIDNVENEIKILEQSKTLLIGSSGGHVIPVSADELRQLADVLVSKVGAVRSALFQIDSAMPGAKRGHASQVSQDARRWDVRRSSLIRTLEDAVGAAKIIQDMADDMDAD